VVVRRSPGLSVLAGLSVGGFLGVGEKLVAVPVTQIKVGAEAKSTTNLPKEQMSAAPAFDYSTLK
jgi:hypothetical protein